MTLIYQGASFNQTFILVSSSDHISPVTGATPTVIISKNAAAFSSPQGAITEIGAGWYTIGLTSTDTNTVGEISFHVTAAGADPTDFTNQIIPVPAQPTPPTPTPTPPTPLPPSGPFEPSNVSGRFNFFPSLGECTLNALSRIRLRGPAVLAEHLHQAWMEANLMQVEWSNRGPNLWKISETIYPTVPGVATYAIPSTAIMVLNVTIGTGDPPNESELTITPMTRQEYVMQPNKATQARPTSFWFDRLIAPTITLWPTPDQVYNMHVWSYGQQFDAMQRGAIQLDVPYRWLDAACAGLSARLAVHYAQDLEASRKAMAKEAYDFAATQDTEDGSIYLLPMIQSYYD